MGFNYKFFLSEIIYANVTARPGIYYDVVDLYKFDYNPDEC